MKICITNGSLDVGGAERVASELANYYASQGHDVYMILIFNKKNFYDINESVKLIEPVIINNKLISWLYLSYYLRNSLGKIKPDLIINFIFPTYFLISTLFTTYPVLISIRNNPKKYEKFDNLLLRKIFFKKATVIMAQTTYAYNVIRKQVNHNNIIVIPNPVKMIKRYNVVRENTIVTVGRLIQGKGLEDLLEIFSKADLHGWVLEIIGDGPLRSKLEKLAQRLKNPNSVRFVGYKRDVDRYLTQAKIFAFTSYSEGFPNALAEAMATPLACISYDCDAGPRDIIKNGKNGFLVPVGRKDIFSRKLTELVNDESLRTRFETEAAITMAEYRADIIGQKILDSFRNTIIEKDVF